MENQDLSENICSTCKDEFDYKLKTSVNIACGDAHCLKCLSFISPQDMTYFCFGCEEDVKITDKIRSRIKNLLNQHQRINLICKLHNDQNANQYCTKCHTYACKQCAKEQHQLHEDLLEIVAYDKLQNKIKSTIGTAQKEIEKLNLLIDKLQLFELEAQNVDFQEFQNIINSITTREDMVQAEETNQSIPSNLSLSDSRDPIANIEEIKTQQFSQSKSKEEEKHSSSLISSQNAECTESNKNQFIKGEPSIQSQSNNEFNYYNSNLSSQVRSIHMGQQMSNNLIFNNQIQAQSAIQQQITQQQIIQSPRVSQNQQLVQERNQLSVGNIQIEEEVKADVSFDAFGCKAIISENFKILNLIRNNSYDPMSIKRQRVKFSYLCFEFLDDMLLISLKLKTLKQYYCQVFLDFEFVDKYCNIYINTTIQVWHNVLSEIENYMPCMHIVPMRDIQRGYEQMLIKAFIENHSRYWNDQQIRVNISSLSDPKLSKYLYTGDSIYSQENEPELIANQGVIVIFLLKRNLTELHNVVQLIYGFVLREYQNLYDLFKLCDETDFTKRAHIAVYLKNKKLIDMSLSILGYQDKQVDYRTHKQKIYVRATQNEYDDFVQDVRQDILSVQTKTLSLKLRIHFMKTYLGNGFTLQQKVQNMFNVYVSETFREVTIIDDKTNLERQVCEYVSIPDNIQMLIQQEHQYRVQVTGVMIDEAVKYIMSIHSDYIFKEMKINYMSPLQHAQLIQRINQIKVQYPVVVCLVQGILYIYGEKSNGQFDEFQKKLIALIPKNPKRN
eukprot:403335583